MIKSYSDDDSRLRIAKAIVSRAEETAERSVIEEPTRVTRTQLVASIQVVLSEAYEQGLALGAKRLDAPAMRLELTYRRLSSHDRAVPVLVDDLGRELPCVAAVDVKSEVQSLDAITVRLVVDGDKVRIRESKDE